MISRNAARILIFPIVAAIGTPTQPGYAQPGGATDAATVVALLKSQDDGMLRIGERLVVDGARFCAESGYSAGMTIQLLAQYGQDYRAAAAASGIGDRPTVTGTAPGSAAATAGLQPGDQIARIDGRDFAPIAASRPSGTFAPTAAALDAIERAMEDGHAQIEIVRAGKHLTVSLTPRRACHARFDVRAGRSANASSDGVQIQVSSDLVSDTRGDSELAAVLAHELAHNILRHPQRLKGPAPRPTVKQTEIEADRLSVYLLDAAGFGTQGAETFWSRWGRAHDWGIFAAGTHPGWKQRIAIIRTEAARIADMKRAGTPVVAPAELAARR